jgi:hypothetical protein
MTDPITPEMPTSGEIMRAVGRTEKAIDALSSKIDKLDDIMDGHADQITRHEVRISVLEKQTDTQQAARSSQGIQVKAAFVAGGLALVASVVETVITLTHH